MKVGGMFMAQIVVMVSQMYTFIPKLITLDTLILYSFLHVNCSSIIWLFRKKINKMYCTKSNNI